LIKISPAAAEIVIKTGLDARKMAGPNFWRLSSFGQNRRPEQAAIAAEGGLQPANSSFSK